MKAAQINKYGAGDAVEINQNAADPILSAGKILVQVRAAGVNPIDWKIREGYLSQMLPLKFPATLGGDFSGIIKELGEGVSGMKPGDSVYGQASILAGGSGSFAAFATADAKTVSLKPDKLSFGEAAALPLAGASALQAITEHINLQKGQKILIHGGAGGIGSYAVQIAKHLGAFVATTSLREDEEYLKKLGADQTIDYQNETFENILQNYDAVFDTVGGDAYLKSFPVLKKDGIILSMTEQPKAELTSKYHVKAVAQATEINQARLEKLTELVERGILRVFVSKTFPLAEAAAALGYLKTKHSRGKIVIEI